MEFSAQIKKIRTDNQLTQEQLAQQLNVSRQTISSWENNRNNDLYGYFELLENNIDVTSFPLTFNFHRILQNTNNGACSHTMFKTSIS